MSGLIRATGELKTAPKRRLSQ